MKSIYEINLNKQLRLKTFSLLLFYASVFLIRFVSMKDLALSLGFSPSDGLVEGIIKTILFLFIWLSLFLDIQSSFYVSGANRFVSVKRICYSMIIRFITTMFFLSITIYENHAFILNDNGINILLCLAFFLEIDSFIRVLLKKRNINNISTEYLILTKTEVLNKKTVKLKSRITRYIGFITLVVLQMVFLPQDNLINIIISIVLFAFVFKIIFILEANDIFNKTKAINLILWIVIGVSLTIILGYLDIQRNNVLLFERFPVKAIIYFLILYPLYRSLFILRAQIIWYKDYSLIKEQ